MDAAVPDALEGGAINHFARNQEEARRRRSRIVAMVRERGAIPVADLAPAFGVSQETIRRDLRALESRRSIIRSYGVIRVAESGSFETELSYRSTNLTEEKQRIADEAVRRFDDARTVFLDEGFLPSLVAASLPEDSRLTVVTASIPVVLRLVERPAVEVIVLGGRARRGTLGLVGADTVDALRGYVPDLAVIGANGITSDGWLTTPDPAVAAVKQAALASAQRRIFIGGHDKFGRVTFTRFARATDFEVMITGRELSAATARSFALMGAEVVRV